MNPKVYYSLYPDDIPRLLHLFRFLGGTTLQQHAAAMCK